MLNGRILHTSLLLVFAFLALLIPVQILLQNTSWKIILFNCAFLIMVIGLYAVLRRGHITLVGGAGLAILFAWVVIACYWVGTVRSPVATGFAIVIILSGFFFGWKGISAAIIASSLAVLALIGLQNSGRLPQPTYSVSILQGFVYICLFAITGSLTYYTYARLKQALERANREIRERQATELQLRQLSLAVEQSPASIVITDLDGAIQYTNPRFTQVTGYTRAEAMGQNPRILKTEYTPLETHKNLWETVTGGHEWRGEFVNRKKDGSYYTESVLISPILNEQGVATHYLAVKEDITERKRIENELKLSEERLRSLFQQTNDAVFLLALDGRHLAANQRACAMLGYSMDEMLQLSIKDLSAELTQSQQTTARLLAGESIAPYERLFRKKNGEILPVEINLQLVRDASGSPTHIQSVARDISERKQAEAALNATLEQLRQRVTEVEHLQAELREQAYHDPLTGLFNRRYLGETLERLLVRAKRLREPVSVVVIDIDHFKTINDTHGHQIGDRFLEAIAAMLTRHTRGSDFICRYGGEEFLMVLPGAQPEDAANRAEEVRQKCQALTISVGETGLHVTMSLGLAAYPDAGQTADEIIAKADQALYYSKANGRNQLTVWQADLLKSV